VVNKAATSTSLYLDGSQANLTVTYGASTNATATTINGTVTLYRDGSSVSNPEIATLGAGTYNYTAINPGDENYSSSQETWFLTVNQAADSVSLYLNGLLNQNVSIIYSTSSNATATSDSSTESLYRDSSSVSNPEIATLAAGLYAYKVNSTGNANHSANTTGVTYYLEVNKSTTTLNLSASPSWNETYGTTTTINCSADNGEVTPQLYRNGTLVSRPDTQTLAAGSYGYTCNASTTQNYTSASTSNTLVINNASTTTSLYLNGTQGNLTTTYGSQTNATATTSVGNVTLYRNGSAVSNPEIVTLGAGTYNYTAINPGDENYSGSEETWFLTVDKASDNLSLYLNGFLNQNLSLIDGTQSNATATSLSGTESLYRDGSPVSNPEITTLPVGTYAYKVNSTGNANYSADSGFTFYLEITSKGSSNCSLTTTPASPNTYGTATNASCSCDNPEASAVLWRNGTDVTATENNENIVLPAGTWGYTCNVTETQNYTSAQNSSTYIVNKSTTALNLTASPGWSETYGTSTTINCSADNSEVTPQLYRNGTLISIPDTQTLAVGSYGYTCNASTTQNYTSASTSNTLVISKASTTTSLFLDGAQDNLTVVNGTQTNATTTTSAVNVTLYRDGSPVANPEIATLAPGFYNYTGINPGDENYTGSSETWFLNVTVVTDNESPVWSGNTTNPASPATYAPGAAYQFNVTWIDNTALDTVLIEHNFTGTLTNYTMITSSGNEYYYDYSDLTAGTYIWKMYANDTSGNENQTDQWTYVVDKASTTTALYLNGAQSNLTTTYGVQTNVTASTTGGSLTLYRNGTSVSNPEITTLGVGSYNYTAITADDANYTGSSETWILTVDKANDTLTLYLNNFINQNVSAANGTQSNATATSLSGTESLYRNGTLVSNPEITTLPLGLHAYKVNSTGNANYSANPGITYYLEVVPKSPSNCTLNLTPASPVTYGTSTNASCSCDNPEASAMLWRNGTDVTATENNIATILPAGTWGYVCNVSETQNYTAAQEIASYTVDKADTTTSLYLDGSQANLTVIYGATTNATATTDGGSVTLYRDGSPVSNPETTTLGVGSYNYTAITADDANYTGSSETWFLTINKASDTVDIYLNGQLNQNVTITSGTKSTVSAISASSTEQLYLNGTLVTNPDINTFSIGTYPYFTNTTGNSNYTSHTGVNYYLTVKAASSGGSRGGGRRVTCVEEWSCTDWGECPQTRLRKRVCTLTKDCPGIESQKPLELERCAWTPPPTAPEEDAAEAPSFVPGRAEEVENATLQGPEIHCSDGLLNHDEEEVDCGGDCPPCQHVEITGAVVGQDRLLGPSPRSLIVFFSILALIAIMVIWEVWERRVMDSGPRASKTDSPTGHVAPKLRTWAAMARKTILPPVKKLTSQQRKTQEIFKGTLILEKRAVVRLRKVWRILRKSRRNARKSPKGVAPAGMGGKKREARFKRDQKATHGCTSLKTRVEEMVIRTSADLMKIADFRSLRKHSRKNVRRNMKPSVVKGAGRQRKRSAEENHVSVKGRAFFVNPKSKRSRKAMMDRLKEVHK